MKRTLLLLICLAGAGFAVAGAARIIGFSTRQLGPTGGVEPGPALQVEAVSNANRGSKESPSNRFGGDKSAPCPSADAISNALQKFKSDKWTEWEEARKLLLDKAADSEGCREQVITALMKAMDRPNLDFTTDSESYNLWLYGAQVLGDLKAVESLDLLISHLKLYNGAFFSASLRHQPALKGVLRMGKVAIPKLEAVLQQDPDRDMRFYAVYGIATIGGPQAVRSLREAANSESDECVRRAIRASLDGFDENGRIKDRMDWYFSLECNQ